MNRMFWSGPLVGSTFVIVSLNEISWIASVLAWASVASGGEIGKKCVRCAKNDRTIAKC